MIDIKLRMLTKLEKDFVRDCVSMICSVVRLYGFEMDGYSPKKTVDHWIYCCSLSSKHPMSFVKYKMASFYAFYKKDYNYDEFEVNVWNQVNSEGKSIDKPGVLLGGKAMRFLSKMERVDPSMYEALCTTMLYAKKGMPRPGKDLLKLAEREAFVKLTTPSKVQEPLILRRWADENDAKVSGFVGRERMMMELRRTVKELFTGKKYTDEDRVKVFTPSTSANYINSRSAGGVIGQLLGEHKDLLEGLTTNENLIQLGGINVGVPSFVHDNGSVVTIRSTEQSLQTVDFSSLDSRFLELYNRICRKALLTERPLAKPLALAEALKTRVISKGPGLLYTALKPLQKFMWGTISKFSTFRLTGEPVTGDILQDIIGANLKDGERFLSVDYSDATNEIEGWTSECVMNAISDVINLTDAERDMAIRSLTGHIMEYEGEEKPQMKGQLMGGILSFPILCIVNATILRMTKEIADDREYTLRDSGCAVNGDDGVIKTTLYGRDIWKAIGSFCGLKPSVGKVYFSRQFLNINSTTYNFHPNGWEGFRVERANGTYAVRVCNYELVKYVNMGLLLGLTRSGTSKVVKGKGQDRTVNVQSTSAEIGTDNMSFGAKATALIQSAPSRLGERIMGQFLHLNRKKIIIDLPYFIPENMGGLGLPAVGKYTSSDADLRYARLIFENKHKYKMPALPVDTAWKFWEYATKRFPFKNEYVNTSFEGGSGMVSLTTLRSKACVEAIFRISDINKLLNDVTDEKAVVHYQQDCRRIWSKARKVTNPPEPYVQGQFPQQYNNNDRPLFHVIN